MYNPTQSHYSYTSVQLKYVLEWMVDADPSEVMDYLFEYIEQNFFNQDLENINRLLANNLIKSRYAIGALRASSRARKLLPNWKLQRDLAIQICKSEGMDEPTIRRKMRGLLELT